MQNKETSLCFSGHRSEKLPQGEQLKALRSLLWEEINKAIEDGIRIFYHGGCFGFDLLAAEIVEQRKRVIDTIDPAEYKLICIIPYEGQPQKWSEDNRNKYYNLMAKCDEAITLNAHYKSGCYYERNRYMVDRSSRLICYCASSKGGTKYTMEYAEKNGLQITNLYEKMDH